VKKVVFFLLPAALDCSLLAREERRLGLGSERALLLALTVCSF
jgi:hypothetical protein